jgi:hypothetical protein
VGGLALGALAAGAANGGYGYGGYGPGYAAPVYGGGDCSVHYRRAWDGYQWVRERVRECY